MNTDPSRLFSHDSKNKIVFIHQGKCGGTSIRETLKTYLPNDLYALFEYHCFNADKQLHEIITNHSRRKDIYFLLSLRDPIERLVSSFNWALHDLGILQGTAAEHHMKWFDNYKTVKDYAEALISLGPNCDQISEIDKYVTHASMGISWYIPMNIARQLPKDRTFSIRLEYLNNDVENCLNRLMNIEGLDIPSEIFIPREKADYKNMYPNDAFGGLGGLTYDQIKSLKMGVLRKDYLVYDYCMRYIL